MGMNESVKILPMGRSTGEVICELCSELHSIGMRLIGVRRLLADGHVAEATKKIDELIVESGCATLLLYEAPNRRAWKGDSNEG